MDNEFKEFWEVASIGQKMTILAGFLMLALATLNAAELVVKIMVVFGWLSPAKFDIFCFLAQILSLPTILLSWVAVHKVKKEVRKEALKEALKGE